MNDDENLVIMTVKMYAVKYVCTVVWFVVWFIFILIVNCLTKINLVKFCNIIQFASQSPKY